MNSKIIFNPQSEGPFDDPSHRASRISDPFLATHHTEMKPPVWIKDEDALFCMNSECGTMFDFWVRKHHCRCCGQVFCEACSSTYAMLPEQFCTKDPERTCDSCFIQLQPLQGDLRETYSNATRVNELNANERYLNSPARFTLGGEVRKAAYTIQNLINGIGTEAFGHDDKLITSDLLSSSKALLFITVMKLAFLGGIRFGTGLVICRTPDGSWSPPCAVMLGGLTVGMQFGAQVVDMVIPLHDDSALAHFSVRGGKHAMVGTELGFTLGPLGRSAEATVLASRRSLNTSLSYSHSRGLYTGVTLDGALVSVRDDINRKFYGLDVDPAHLFDGTVQRPVAAEPLYDKLEEYATALENLGASPRLRHEADAAVGTGLAAPEGPALTTETALRGESRYEEFNSEFAHSDDEALRDPFEVAV